MRPLPTRRASPVVTATAPKRGGQAPKPAPLRVDYGRSWFEATREAGAMPATVSAARKEMGERRRGVEGGGRQGSAADRPSPAAPRAALCLAGHTPAHARDRPAPSRPSSSPPSDRRRAANRAANNGLERKDLYTDNWAGSEYRGSGVNILTVLIAITVLTPLLGIGFAFATYGKLWG